MKKRMLMIILLLFLLINCAGVNKNTDFFDNNDIRGKIFSLISDANFDNANWGIYISRLKDGDIIFSHNSDKVFMPASNMKLVTTSAALKYLGPDFTFKTYICYNGNIKNKILNGDLVIFASGDPSISPHFYNDQISVLKDWVNNIKDFGIDSINGNIVVDLHIFGNDFLGKGWAWDFLTDYYAAQISPLCFNDNTVDIKLFVDENNNFKYSFYPDISFINIIDNKIEIKENLFRNDVIFVRERGTNNIRIFGEMNKEDTVKESITINEPYKMFMNIFRSQLEKGKIGFGGDVIYDYEGMYSKDSLMNIFVYESKTLSEIIEIILKKSHNLMAEQVFRYLGYKYTGLGTNDNALKFFNEVYFPSIGVDPHRIQMYDGSGLSRYNLISPKALVAVLEDNYKTKYFDIFYNSLPIAGKDGTLRSRMKNMVAENNVHAKTGFIFNARTLSGYLTTKNGNLIVFSLMANNYTVPTKLVNNVQDKICSLLINSEF